MSSQPQPVFYFKGNSTTNSATKGADGETSQKSDLLSSYQNQSDGRESAVSNNGSFLSTLLGRSNNSGSMSSHVRKVPVKIEPKVYFANERTFLAWLHMALTLASISVGVVVLADNNGKAKLYGLTLLPVAIAFTIYALYKYIQRATMIQKKQPGPYEDKVGLMVLSVMLSIAIVLNLYIKLS